MQENSCVIAVFSEDKIRLPGLSFLLIKTIAVIPNSAINLDVSIYKKKKMFIQFAYGFQNC